MLCISGTVKRHSLNYPHWKMSFFYISWLPEVCTGNWTTLRNEPTKLINNWGQVIRESPVTCEESQISGEKCQPYDVIKYRAVRWELGKKDSSLLNSALEGMVVNTSSLKTAYEIPWKQCHP